MSSPRLMPADRSSADAQELTAKVSRVVRRRFEVARERFVDRMSTAWKEEFGTAPASRSCDEAGRQWQAYVTDLAERSILFWDTMRQRGNVFLEHERAGKPPVLHFDYETVLDARQFARPVNYALLRIVPPPGVTLDPRRRPYLVIDPRAGHGPGIGGFKDDSQVGVALRSGHPVYFVVFYPEPMPGQTLLDVCDAETRFVHEVRRLHPASPRPAIVGNCQGGWAAMMLAAAEPDETGPVVINGAPMSYWGGAWQEGEGNNPMRYAGGLLGGSWLASLCADIGHGQFDGAHLVWNFENLNPANTFWDKYYHLFAHIDTEPPRFLEFERWWGGYFRLNREEITWIVDNLFVGNELWSGSQRTQAGRLLDLRSIKVPIIMFASLGDNITPPQQAFNWVADVYGSTDAIKANGQVIVGLLHQQVGHLGIFVSGKVAKKEHAQIVSVMKSIEALPPGLYGMQIHETRGPDGQPVYDVEFHEQQLEEVMVRLNRFGRRDELPFAAARTVSEFYQRAYDIFWHPLVQAASNEVLAEWGRTFHPLRWQRWALSDLNPWMWWLEPMARSIRTTRSECEPTQPFRRWERLGSALISGTWDLYRDLRDAAGEALFFQLYGQLLLANDALVDPASVPAAGSEPGRESLVVQESLDAMEEGGYAEAVARAAALLAERGHPIPLADVELRQELLTDYRDYLPHLPRDQMRRVRGMQEVLVKYERARALETLPQLLRQSADRTRLLEFLQRVLADPRIAGSSVTDEQRLTLEQIRKRLSEKRPPEERRSLRRGESEVTA